ncbi:MAG: methenyltetrahydromethanopterin cyclohydrolase [Gemmataceae bacterium]
MTKTPTLNEKAQRQADFLAANATNLRIAVTQTAGAKLMDFGIETAGGLQAGLGLARVCLAGLAEVSLISGDVAGVATPLVQISSDSPVLACMASQYAGWNLSTEGIDYFAMASGPMRAAWAKEELFQSIPGAETPPVAVGTLETKRLPPPEIIQHLSQELKLPPEKITLLAAPAASLAGTIQVVARSLETALHKLHELRFDLSQIVSGLGTAPLPPVGANELAAIGRTNDAILYGGRVVLWVRGEDDQLAEIGRSVPANASSDYGVPFATIFQRCGHDFYKIDPMLFSPAEVVFHNLSSGRSHAFGRTKPDVMWTSFYGS